MTKFAHLLDMSFQRVAVRLTVLARLLCLALLALVGTGVAQTLTLTPPNSRFAEPGDYVTFVFRAEASGTEAGTVVSAEARSSSGWKILRQPGELTLAPGQSRPIALTLAVPADAPAFAEDTLTLTLRTATDELSVQTTVTVNERTSLDLDAPETVVLSAKGVNVTLINRGNVTSAVRLELRQRGEVLVARERELAPQERRVERLEVSSEGSYTLVLTSGEQVVRKTLTVTRFGVPPPHPFRLNAVASASLSTESWGGELTAEGPLSDFVSLTARLDAKDMLSSYAEMQHEVWTAQVGGSGGDPYNLGLSSGTGVSGSYEAPRWSVAGALSAEKDAPGYVAGAYHAQVASVALGAGIRSGDAQFSARGSADLGAFSVAAKASDDALDASLEGERKLSTGRLRGSLKLTGLLTDGASASTQLDYYGPGRHLYAKGSLGATSSRTSSGSKNSSDSKPAAGWSIGLQDRLIFDDLPSLPGDVTLSLEMGSAQNVARLQYETPFADAWLADAQFGVVYGAELALDTSARLARRGTPYYSLESDLTYYPSTRHLEGQLDLKLQMNDAPLTFFSNGTWNVEEKRLGLNAGTVLYSGPWRVNVAGNANYGYGSGAGERPFTLGLSLSSDYAFDVGVPRRASEFAGGRRLGAVQGVVRSDEGPLAGVEVRVGRFRILTDEAGRYRADVEPGTYKVSLEVTSLPITYRLLGSDTVFAEVALKEEVTWDFRLARTAALRGRVLEDADADGVADTPARGLAARLLLIDTEGLYRSLSADEQGNFSARGLLPGEATLQLVDYPAGSVLLGDAARQLTVSAGEVVEVTYLLQPARTRARSFGGSKLRVRRVTPTAERAPPGSAPLIRVSVQGDAESVSVSTPAGKGDLFAVEGGWFGRVNVPADTPPGVYTFEVVARRGDETASRRGQLVVDPDVARLEVTADGPVRAGESLDLFAEPLFEAAEVSMQSLLGNVQLTEEEPGRYSAVLPVAADAEDAVYDLVFRAATVDGTVTELTRRVRVLNTSP